MPKIVGFGDSFIFGSEIPGNHDGSLAWPALAAQSLGWEYSTSAKPGCGNDHIARQIYQYFAHNPTKDCLAVINWTWMMRWDLHLHGSDQWVTLGPSCVPETLRNQLDFPESVIDFYQSHVHPGALYNKIRCLQTIASVQYYLQTKDIKSVQTNMDFEIFDLEWHAPDYVRELRDLTWSQIHTWEGKNFLDWCQDRGHEITQPGLHPLATAHQDAAEFWKETYDNALA